MTAEIRAANPWVRNPRYMWVRHLLAFGVFFAISWIYFGQPVIGHLTTRYIGVGSDPLQYIYAMRWWPWAVTHGLNPFIDHWLWAPMSLPLLWVTSVPSISFIMSPVTFIVGPVASYNIAMIIGPALAAVAMYFLLTAVLEVPTVSHWLLQMMGGYLFGFSSYELGEMLGHLNLTWIFPIPLLAMIGLLVYRRIRMSTVIPLKYRVWAVVLLLILFGVSIEIFTTAAFFMVSFVLTGTGVFVVARHQGSFPRQQYGEWMRLIKWIVLTAAIAAVFLSPLLVVMMLRTFYSGAPNSPTFYSADLLNYIIPTITTQVGGHAFQGVSANFLGNASEEGAYLGIPLVIAGVLSMVTIWNRIWMRILFIALVFVILCSFGPVLHVDGRALWPMPWSIFVRIPLLGDALPTRFSMYVSFFVALIVPIGIESLAPQIRTWSLPLFLLSVFALVPNISVARIASSFVVPQFFSNQKLIHEEIPKGAITMVFPYGNQGNAITLQEASRFWFRLANGYLGSVPQPINSWPIVNAFWTASGSVPVGRYFTVQFAALLARQHVTRIVATEGYQTSVSDLLRPLHGIREIYAGRGVNVWKVSKGIDTDLVHNSVSATLASAQLIQFHDLKVAVTRWLRSHPSDSAAISPLFLESKGLLPTYFGGIAKPSPAWNWTTEGGWAGAWSDNLYAVGVTATPAQADDLFKRYRDLALEVYYPYPKVMRTSRLKNHTKTPEELLMVFAPPESAYVSQFRSLVIASNRWVNEGRSASAMSPTRLEAAGFLNKGYGGFPRSLSNWQWTAEGGWAGGWGKAPQFAVGIYGPWSRIKPIINLYKHWAVATYFPYPHEVTMPLHSNTMGQLLMVFK